MSELVSDIRINGVVVGVYYHSRARARINVNGVDTWLGAFEFLAFVNNCSSSVYLGDAKI